MKKVELISVWGDDNTVCDCARVSFNKRAENYTKENNIIASTMIIGNKTDRLIRYDHFKEYNKQNKKKVNKEKNQLNIFD